MCQLSNNMTTWYYICTNRFIGMNGVLEITKFNIDTGKLHQANCNHIDVEVCRVPDTGLSIFNYKCIVTYTYVL